MLSPGRKVAVLLALVLLLSGGIIGFSQYRSVRDAHTTTGTVTDVEMERYESGVRTSGETTTYEPQVTYTYTVDGETYTGDDIAFGSEFDTNSRERATDLVSQFEAGSSVTVYYNPADPDQAYLIPQFDFLPAGALIAAGLLLFADSLTPWSRVSRAVITRIPLSMHLGSRFATEGLGAVSAENPTAILEARQTMNAPRTAPLWGPDASAVWLACGLCILLTVVGYLQLSRPPYDVGAFVMLGIPIALNARVLHKAVFG